MIWRHSANGRLGGVCACCWLLTGGWRGRSQNCAPYMGSGRGWLAGDWPSTGGVLNITAAAWTAGFLWWHSGNKKRTQNVSEYMFGCQIAIIPYDGWIHWPARHRAVLLFTALLAYIVIGFVPMRTVCFLYLLWCLLPVSISIYFLIGLRSLLAMAFFCIALWLIGKHCQCLSGQEACVTHSVPSARQCDKFVLKCIFLKFWKLFGGIGDMIWLDRLLSVHSE